MFDVDVSEGCASAAEAQRLAALLVVPASALL